MPTIHIHSFLLARHRPLLDDAAARLTADEWDRASRFKVDGARDEFLLSRLLLRETLADHLKQPAAGIGFAYTPHGKPMLQPAGRAGFEFNLSHSHGRLLIAVCQGIPVGIDIEWIDPSIDPIPMAEHGLPEAALRQLRAAAEDQRHDLFFRLWTRWEAYLKALGKGFLAARENPPGIGLGDATPAGNIPDSTRMAVIHDLPIAPDFKAAVALVADTGWPDIVNIEWHDFPAP